MQSSTFSPTTDAEVTVFDFLSSDCGCAFSWQEIVEGTALTDSEVKEATLSLQARRWTGVKIVWGCGAKIEGGDVFAVVNWDAALALGEKVEA